MKVAVTGAAGFVGTNLLDRLVEQGHEVIAIDRVRPAHAIQSDLVTWKSADVLDPESLRDAFEGAEIVYHLVAMITLAQNNDLAWRINTTGVGNVAEAALAAGVRRLVHCSSIHSFDQYAAGGFIDETSSRSTDPKIPVYDRSKWFGEVELRKVIDKGLDAVICNPTGVYGPVDHGPSRINGLLRDAARGRVPAMIQGGFDLVDVRDVAIGLTLAAEHGRTGENYLLGGEMVTIYQAMRAAARRTGRRGPVVTLPLSFFGAVVPILEPIGAKFGSDVLSRASLGAILHSPVVDRTKAGKELGYSPRSSEQSIADLVDFYSGAGELSKPRLASAVR
ncbi:NAD-dependent epimerase/dehydratase family protein [Aldersonia kunmingensis]|uniref:NAD-dependent epimerase/dehydratase family protein n=1 Tax=Aldersonia kunmingensis TaxID=408066 RepID=UPI000835D61E|nr:NAD-dependent epimerase/dehydratase family protein [Aldersonia kunmingensis]